MSSNIRPITSAILFLSWLGDLMDSRSRILKAQIAEQAARAGGPIGGASAQATATLVQVGYGAYVAALVDLIILVAFFVKGPTEVKPAPPQATTPAGV